MYNAAVASRADCQRPYDIRQSLCCVLFVVVCVACHVERTALPPCSDPQRFQFLGAIMANSSRFAPTPRPVIAAAHGVKIRPFSSSTQSAAQFGAIATRLAETATAQRCKEALQTSAAAAILLGRRRLLLVLHRGWAPLRVVVAWWRRAVGLWARWSAFWTGVCSPTWRGQSRSIVRLFTCWGYWGPPP